MKRSIVTIVYIEESSERKAKCFIDKIESNTWFASSQADNLIISIEPVQLTNQPDRLKCNLKEEEEIKYQFPDCSMLRWFVIYRIKPFGTILGSIQLNSIKMIFSMRL